MHRKTAFSCPLLLGDRALERKSSMFRKVLVSMDQFKSDFLRSLSERGYIHQITDAAALDARATAGVISAYIGFDATADSLHIGSLVQIMMLRRLQQAGHRPVVLMGGGTTKIGDPSGRDETRRLLTEEQIQANIAGIREIFARYLSFDGGPTGAIMANNDDWLGELQYIPFLRDIGRHFTINRMLTMDSVKLRLEREQPLTFLEFNYMVMQSYDFVELFKRYGCILQLGGSDQWGNIVQGVELGRRMSEAQLFGLTSPLITTSSGAKMGKTASGAVWLNAKRLPPYDYWQFWRNTEDGDVGRFLRMFTDLPLDEIGRLEKLEGAEINAAKQVLATEATRLCHGEDAAREVAETAAHAFAGSAAEGLPTFSLSGGAPVLIVDIAVALGMAGSKGEARRLIAQGGVRLNDQVVTDAHAGVTGADLGQSGTARLSVGKKRHALIRQS
jgi:tyrosyl-tRNA synthetase